jgi:hypothetical protein
LKVRLNVLESNKRRIEGEKEETADELKEIVEHSSRGTACVDVNLIVFCQSLVSHCFFSSKNEGRHSK